MVLLLIHGQHDELPEHKISPFVLVAFVIYVNYAIVSGFVLRRKFFKRSTETFPSDQQKALQLWRAAHLIAFASAMNLTVFGLILKWLGSGWLVPGISSAQA